jgi:hypothetical protein
VTTTETITVELDDNILDRLAGHHLRRRRQPRLPHRMADHHPVRSRRLAAHR